MRTFSEEEIDIIKETLKEYDYISRQLNHEIKEGASMEQLLDYLETEFDVDITNSELKEDYKYIDFNYGTGTYSIISNKDVPTHLSRYVEIWDDKNCRMITSITDINELRKVVDK